MYGCVHTLDIHVKKKKKYFAPKAENADKASVTTQTGH